MPESVQRFELVLDEPEHAEPSPTRVSWRRVIAVGVAFLIGAALGMTAVDRQRDSGAARAERAEISLVAVIVQQRDQHRYLINVYNAGSLPVQLSEPRLIVPGYDDPPAGAATQRFEQETAPGRWATLGLSTGAVTCGDEPTSRDAILAVQVRTDDGEVRPVEVPVLDGTSALATERSAYCGAIRHPETTVNAWMDAGIQDGDGATRPPALHIETWGQRAVEIIDVTSDDDKLGIKLEDDLPLVVSPPSPLIAPVEITVRDCDIQLVGAEIMLTTRFRDQTATLPVWIDPMVLQSVVAASPTCGGE